MTLRIFFSKNRTIVIIAFCLLPIVIMSSHLLCLLAYYYNNMGFRENLKSELTYSGILVKELAAKSGVNKYSIDNYLNKRGQTPSVEVAVKIAQALGVSVEYLVTGKEDRRQKNYPLSTEARIIARHADQLNDKNRAFVLDFIKWLKTREV